MIGRESRTIWKEKKLLFVGTLNQFRIEQFTGGMLRKMVQIFQIHNSSFQ